MKEDTSVKDMEDENIKTEFYFSFMTKDFATIVYKIDKINLIICLIILLFELLALFIVSNDANNFMNARELMYISMSRYDGVFPQYSLTEKMGNFDLRHIMWGSYQWLNYSHRKFSFETKNIIQTNQFWITLFTITLFCRLVMFSSIYFSKKINTQTSLKNNGIKIDQLEQILNENNSIIKDEKFDRVILTKLCFTEQHILSNNIEDNKRTISRLEFVYTEENKTRMYNDFGNNKYSQSKNNKEGLEFKQGIKPSHTNSNYYVLYRFSNFFWFILYKTVLDNIFLLFISAVNIIEMKPFSFIPSTFIAISVIDIMLYLVGYAKFREAIKDHVV